MFNVQSPKSAPAIVKFQKTFGAVTAFFEHVLRFAGAHALLLALPFAYQCLVSLLALVLVLATVA